MRVVAQTHLVRLAMEHQELFAGFVRLHILHHAAEREVHGLWIIGELARHGYRLSPGTLYPMLHALDIAAPLSFRAIIVRPAKTFRQVGRDGPVRRKVYRLMSIKSLRARRRYIAAREFEASTGFERV